jgi:hypothetical protein
MKKEMKKKKGYLENQTNTGGAPLNSGPQGLRRYIWSGFSAI